MHSIPPTLTGKSHEREILAGLDAPGDERVA